MMLSLSALYYLLLPFFFAANIAPDIDLSVGRIFALGLFGVWTTLSLARRRLWLPEPPILFLVLLFLSTAFFSASWAAEPGWALRKAVFLLNYFLLLFVLVGVLANPGARERLSRAFSLGAGLAASVALVQFTVQFFVGVPATFAFWTSKVLPFFLGSAFSETVRAYPSLLVNISGETYMRASGLFPDPHLFGLYAGLGAAMAYGLYRETRGKNWAILALFLSLGVALSFSRGAYLALAAAVFLAALRSLYWRIDARKLWGGVGILIVLLLFAFSSPVGERARSVFSLSDGSNSARLAIWREAAGTLSERPFFGVGLGNYPLEVNPRADYREPIYAHSLYLDLPLELGFAGAFSFFALLGAALWRLFRWARTDALAEGQALALSAFLVHSVFETPIFSVHLLPALLLLLAFAFAPHSRKRP